MTSDPDLSDPEPDDAPTERQVERAREDSEFTPVVLKRSDQVIRHPDDVLQTAIREGAEQSLRPLASLLLSAISAGAILAFTAMAVGVMTMFAADLGGVASRILVALVYPLGFVLVLMSGTQLFTEHTALAVYPMLDGRSSVRSMLRVWLTVLGGNLIGCVIGAFMLSTTESVVGAGEGYRLVADHMLHFAPGATFASAILAGWLMALGGWLVLSTPPDVSQIVVIYFTTFLIGLGGLHHSIAGTAEVVTAAFVHGVDAWSAVVHIGTAIAGNLVGGSVFVAVLNYGHIRQTQRR